MRGPIIWSYFYNHIDCLAWVALKFNIAKDLSPLALPVSSLYLTSKRCFPLVKLAGRVWESVGSI